MNQTETVNVRQLLRDTPEFGSEEISLLEHAIYSNQTSAARQEIDSLRLEVESAAKPPDADLMRVGIGYYYLGQHRLADQYLSRVKGNPVATFYHALVMTSQARHTEAEQKFQEAAKQGYDPVECTLRRVGEIRLEGRLDEAEKLLRSTGAEGAKRAEYSYQMGCILADRGDTYGAAEYLERAVDMDPQHSRALFALAAENALYGNDDEAVRLYERSLSKPPRHLGALLNLGLLYEDQENYSAAAYCFRRVLEADPMNQRAILYLKDIEAASHMYYDEETARREARMQQLLNRPITDFELTVRSRNCLESIGIRTLGDLTRVTEEELLASKNFGETSLSEVTDLMHMHGLEIGQNVHMAPVPEPAYVPSHLSPQEQAVLDTPISDLNLSVRARKCMARLGITKLSELVRRTPDELLASKNFGVTSLNEVRGKLEEYGLRLRND